MWAKLNLIVFYLTLSCVAQLTSLSSEKTLNCKVRQSSTSYECLVTAFETHEEAATISKIIAKHAQNKSNVDFTVLTIRGQTTSFIPKNIKNFFPNLERLEVKNSSLVSVSKDDFKGLIKLETLILDYNFIQNLSTNVFEDLTTLKTLRLSGNKLSELEHKVFSYNTELEIIALEDNKIASLHENQFANLHKLRKVYLKNNEIDDLREQTFANNLKLTTIDIRNNRLNKIGPELLKNLVELKNFEFQNNECIKKSYKTVEELSQIFHNYCLPPYFKNYVEKIEKLSTSEKALNETLMTCETNSQTLTEEKTRAEQEKESCVSENGTCESNRADCEVEKNAKESELEKASEGLKTASEKLEETFKTLTECRLSEEKCHNNNNSINETVAAALKKSAYCISQLDAMRDLTRLNNASIVELETELEIKSLEIIKLQNQLNAYKKNVLLSSSANSIGENCEQQNNELMEIKSKLTTTENKLKSAIAQLPACNSFLIVCSYHSGVGKSSKPEGYACKAKHISACQPGMKLTSVEGTHELYKSNMNVETLEVKDSIFHFPDDIFKHLPNLRVIRVNNSGLSSLKPKLTSSKLVELDIFENKFSEIPEKIFEGLENLESLILDRNDIQRLHSDSFAGLSWLKQLSLKDNMISDLPDGIFNELSSLTAISLNNNRLTSLSGELFVNNPNLQIVMFNENKDLQYIGGSLLNFSNSLKMAQFRGTCVGLLLNSSIEETKRNIQNNCKM